MPIPNPHLHAPERYQPRNVATRGLGSLNSWRAVTRYSQYARRCLDFLYLAGTGIGQASNINAI